MLCAHANYESEFEIVPKHDANLQSACARRITSTMVYTHLTDSESDEHYTATSKSLKEDEDLLKAGFEYVTERDRVKIYQKRK